jgi:hypothetical protein
VSKTERRRKTGCDWLSAERRGPETWRVSQGQREAVPARLAPLWGRFLDTRGGELGQLVWLYRVPDPGQHTRLASPGFVFTRWAGPQVRCRVCSAEQQDAGSGRTGLSALQCQ